MSKKSKNNLSKKFTKKLADNLSKKSKKNLSKKSMKTLSIRSSKSRIIDFKPIILEALKTMSKKESILKNFFKVRAYNKVITQLNNLSQIKNWDDLITISGIGEKIKDKINEIFKSGKLLAAERAQETMNLKIYDKLLEIHGIGIAKAKDLIENKEVTSISKLKKILKKEPKLLNKQQKIGLRYLYDLRKRIPRKEMNEHNKFLSDIFKKVDPDIKFSIVGSYRRNEKDSGDIDILISGSNKMMNDILGYLNKYNYIIETLATGKKKFMGVVKLPNEKTNRHLDILITNTNEYPFAQLYFTGNFDINILLRNEAIKKGLKLNERALVNIKTGKKIKLNSEKEIFNKLGFEYIPPKKRTLKYIEEYRIKK